MDLQNIACSNSLINLWFVQSVSCLIERRIKLTYLRAVKRTVNRNLCSQEQATGPVRGVFSRQTPLMPYFVTRIKTLRNGDHNLSSRLKGEPCASWKNIDRSSSFLGDARHTACFPVVRLLCFFIASWYTPQSASLTSYLTSRQKP